MKLGSFDSGKVAMVLAAGLIGLAIGRFSMEGPFSVHQETFLISAPRHICVSDCWWCGPDRAIFGPQGLQLYLISHMSRPAKIRNFGREPDTIVAPETGLAYSDEYYRRDFCFDYEPIGETSGRFVILYRFRGIF